MGDRWCAQEDIKSEALTPQESGTITAEADAFTSHLGDTL